MPEIPYTHIQPHTEAEMQDALDKGWQEIQTQYYARQAAGVVEVHQSLGRLALIWSPFEDDAHKGGVAFILKYLDSCKSGLSDPVARLQRRLVTGIHITLQTLGYDINNLPAVIEPKKPREI